jgi:hypothetical protein
MSNHNHFGIGGCFKCCSCGKLTRDTGVQSYGADVCPFCYEEGGLENQHSDEGHGGNFEECPICNPIHSALKAQYKR